MNFRITGEYITDMARSLWIDKSKPSALAYLQETLSGIDEIQALSILTGKKKLIGDSVEGIDIVNDDTYSKEDIPLSLDYHLKELENKLGRLEDDRELDACITTVVSDPLIEGGFAVIPKRRGLDFNLGKITLNDMPHYSINQTEIMAVRNERRRLNYPLEIIEEIIRNDKRPPPKPTYKITGSDGWLSPDGAFYVCKRFGHVNLAFDMDVEEHTLEKLGWVKIASDKFFGNIGTQTQIDTIFDRCIELGIKVPKRLGFGMTCASLL